MSRHNISGSEAFDRSPSVYIRGFPRKRRIRFVGVGVAIGVGVLAAIGAGVAFLGQGAGF